MNRRRRQRSVSRLVNIGSGIEGVKYRKWKFRYREISADIVQKKDRNWYRLVSAIFRPIPLLFNPIGYSRTMSESCVYVSEDFFVCKGASKKVGNSL